MSNAQENGKETGRETGRETENAFQCVKCGVPLTSGKVTVSYLGSRFPVDLLRCSECGFVLVSEDLALGRMLQVEKTLEDK